MKGLRTLLRGKQKPKREVITITASVNIGDYVAINHAIAIEVIRNIIAFAILLCEYVYPQYKIELSTSDSKYGTSVLHKNHSERKEMDNTVVVEIDVQIDSKPNQNGIEMDIKKNIVRLLKHSPTFRDTNTKFVVETTP